MAIVIEDILKELKKETLASLEGAGTDLRKELETRLATIDQLVRDGRFRDARLTVSDLGRVIGTTVDGLKPRFDETLLQVSAQKIRTRLVSELHGALAKAALPFLGAQAGALASILTAVVGSLFEPAYETVDLSSYATADNRLLIGQAIAGASIVESFHAANFRSVEKMASFYTAMRPKRDSFLVKVLCSELLTDATKKAVYQFQRQWHVITPGQRNLLKQIVDKLGVVLTGSASGLGDVDAAVGALEDAFGDGAVRPAAPTSASLAKRFGDALFKGVVAKYPKVWDAWFPRDFGPATHLGHELTDLLPPAQRKEFLDAIQGKAAQTDGD